MKAIGLTCSSSRLLLIFVRPNNQKFDPIVICKGYKNIVKVFFFTYFVELSGSARCKWHLMASKYLCQIANSTLILSPFLFPIPLGHFLLALNEKKLARSDFTNKEGLSDFLSFLDRVNTNYIVKFNLRTGQQEAQISLSGYTPRKNYYDWSIYSGVDLAVDENGLWVLWGSTGNSYRLYASKINVRTNSITHTWNLATGMCSTGVTIICYFQ